MRCLPRDAQALRQVVRSKEQDVNAGERQDSINRVDSRGAFDLQYQGNLLVRPAEELRRRAQGEIRRAHKRIVSPLPERMESGSLDGGFGCFNGRDLRDLNTRGA